ncbi:Hypothetical predicted protein, partial [Paramuricea clavata]
SKCKVNYNASRIMMTWEDAKTYCSTLNESLLDFTDAEDLQYIKNISASDLMWIGLKKNAFNLTGILANVDDLFKVGVCEYADINGQLIRNSSCTDKLLSSVCVKPSANCKYRSKRNNSRCCRPVYDRMTYFGAFAHCKRLSTKIYAGNFSNCKDTLFNTSHNLETPLVWTGKLYESTIDARAKWTWLNGSLFKEWNKWEIIITDVGCNGCSFVRNGTIYLTSNCSQNFSCFCNSSDWVGQGQMSWKDAKSSCRLLQFPLRNNTFLMNTENKSYWLPIHKKDACETRMVKDPTNVTEIKPKKCHYVGHLNGSYGEPDCNQKNCAICVKSAETNCSDPWQHFKECHNYSTNESTENWCNAGYETNLAKRCFIGLKRFNNYTNFTWNSSFYQWDKNGYCVIATKQDQNTTFNCTCKKK